MNVGHNTLVILDKIDLWLFILAFVATPFLIVNWIRYMKDLYGRKKRGESVSQFAGLPYKSVLAFVTPILLVFLVSSIMTNAVRSDALRFLSAAARDATVAIDGNSVPNAPEIISELQKLSTYVAHHSHPERVIQIVVAYNGNTLRLNLGRDSGRPNEYWVFYPRYRHTSANEIGRITTNVFDSYK